jgi:hypothetical protein
MPWKMNGESLALDTGGNPIFVKDDGSEASVEAGTISRLNGEAKSHRERAEKAETALKNYEGLDPTKAREALDTVAKLGDKKLIENGEVEKLKTQINEQYQVKVRELESTLQNTVTERDNLIRRTTIQASKFLQERVAVPAEMFESVMAKNFKVEDGKVVPYDLAGNKVMSNKRFGEVADIDEAFEIIVNGYAHKDTILKAPNMSGTGNTGAGAGAAGSKTMKRDDFMNLHPSEQAKTMKQGIALID